MMSGAAVKLRLVRCPKCWQILPESPDFPVYRCGGCGTHLRAKNHTSNTSSSTSESDADQTKKLSQTHVEVNFPSSGDCSVAENELRVHAEYFNGDNEQLGGLNSTIEDQTDGNDQNASEDVRSDHLECINLPSEELKDDDHKDESHSLCGYEQIGGTDLSNEKQYSSNNADTPSSCEIEGPRSSSEVSSPTKLTHSYAEAECSLPFTRADPATKVDEERSGLSVSESEAQSVSSSEKMVDTKESNSVTNSHMLEVEIMSPNVPAPSHNLQSELHQESIQGGLNRVKSTDTFETADYVDPSSELSGILVDLVKSPTINSSRTYYDDRVSSYEKPNDRIPNRRKQSSEGFYKPEKSVYPHGSHEIHQPRNHCAWKSSSMDQVELTENNRSSQLMRDRKMMERNDYSSQLPSRRGFLPRYEGDTSSSQLRNGFYRSSSFHNDRAANVEKERIKLLRMVYDLQDQLDRAGIVNERSNGRVSAGVRRNNYDVQTYYNHEVLEEELFCNQPQYVSRLREGRNWLPPNRRSQFPFQQMSTDRGHGIDHSLHCRLRERRFSAQLPQAGHHTKQLRRTHSGIVPYHPNGSRPSNPQRLVNTEYPRYGSGTNFEVRGKHCQPKRHLRPIAGGAPFVICTRCLRPLHLPQDFLLFKRKCHRVKCGACSKVQEFSLNDKSHLIRFTPSLKVPPPSEADDYSGTINRRIMASRSHFMEFGPTSSFEDNGPSFRKSLSLDQDPRMHQDSAVNERKLMYGSEERGKRGNKYKNTVETQESTGFPHGMSILKNVSSIRDETTEQGSSPLHRLMGYSSPSRLIYS